MIPVTTQAFAGSFQTRLATRKVVIAFPIPMCATRIDPARKEQIEAVTFCRRRRVEYRRRRASSSSSFDERPPLSSSSDAWIENSFPPPRFGFRRWMRTLLATMDATTRQNTAKSRWHCRGDRTGENVANVAPNQAGSSAKGTIPQAMLDGSFRSHDRKPKTPFPKVMVATAKAAPSFSSTPTRSCRAGTKTIPPPTGTALAREAEAIPKKGIAQADNIISRSITDTTSAHHNKGRMGMRRIPA
mmetsp:Transcript_18307/g.42158  ORF Transcript_18307/g.42158 Transcript_18307/m.42158 type:complete len:244 (+) Transcript_18307:907-1638(+)